MLMLTNCFEHEGKDIVAGENMLKLHFVSWYVQVEPIETVGLGNDGRILYLKEPQDGILLRICADQISILHAVWHRMHFAPSFS